MDNKEKWEKPELIELSIDSTEGGLPLGGDAGGYAS